MTDPAAKYWADRLRVIAAQVKAWENRDVREQRERGERALSRPAFFVDLEDLAAALDGESARWAASVKPRQNWPRTVENFDRDWSVAELIDQHRLDPQSTVAKGKAAAAEHFIMGADLVDAVWKSYGRYWRDGTASIMGPFLRLKAARFPIEIKKVKG